MRRLAAYLVLGIAVLAAGISAAWLLFVRDPPLRIEQILAAYREDARYGGLRIRYPLDGTLFPPEIVAPTFRWEESRPDCDTWLVTIKFQDGGERMSFSSGTPEWTPSHDQWEIIKRRSLEKAAKVTILGVRRRRQDEILSAGGISISTSPDEVGAPLFYREVHLPFAEAVTDPETHIRWRFGTIDSRKTPPVVLERLPNCANCHSFTADGSLLAMEIDSANDKGSYVIAPVEEEMVFDEAKVMTWSDYQREDNKQTFGLLPQISPDGKYAICMVKDRSVFVTRPDLAFSQLFFPIRGVLVCYRVETKTFHALPGADDPEYVQANPTWSPDGKYVVFARHKAYYLKNIRHNDSILLKPYEAAEFLKEGKTFPYDLYRIPFNDGQGGTPEPLAGASNNGMSNYFPKYSPDGKWIVFCKARSFMLLQPDSELYIIPAEGGKARRLECNTKRMNSWHSWSPNGKWLAFSSKAYSPYTQLFLTHIDERGRSTPPVVLAHFTGPNKAVNIPEFLNAKPGTIKRIRQTFLNDLHFYRAGLHALREDDYDSAIRAYRKALKLNPKHADAHCELGVALMYQEKLQEAEGHFRKAIELDPDFGAAYSNLGNVLARQGRFQDAVEPCRKAVEIHPDDPAAHLVLGQVLLELGDVAEGRTHLTRAARLNPEYAQARRSVGLGDASRKAGKLSEAADHYRRALAQSPDFVPGLLALASLLATADEEDLRNGRLAVRLATKGCDITQFKDPEALAVLAAAHAETGRFEDAVYHAQRALRFARTLGTETLAANIQRQLELYRQRRPSRESDSR